MNEKRPTYEELEKKLADAVALTQSLRGEIDNAMSERNNALLGTRDLQEAYVESEQNFRNSLDACPLGIRIITEDGELIYANQASLDIFGFNSFEKMKEVPINQLYTPENFAVYQKRKEKRQRGEYVPPEYEVSIRRPDGEVKNLHVFRREVIWGGERKFMAMYLDITERKKAEEALQQSEEMFTRAFHTSPNLMVISTLQEGRIVEINEAYCRVTGYKREELIGHTTIELNVWNNPGQRKVIIQKLEKEGQVNNIEGELRIKSGEIRSLVFSMARITLNDEPCLVTIASDITERKRLEENLKKEQQEIRTIINSAPILVFYKDLEGKLLRVNRAFAQALNMPEEDFVGKTVFDLYSADIAQGMTADDREVLKSGRPKLDIIEQYESVSGLRWVQTDKVPILDDKGIPIGLIGFAQDITERKRAEEALRESEEKFSKVFRSSGSAICITSLPDNKYLEVNERFTWFTGYTREEVIGHSAVELKLWVYDEELRRFMGVLEEKGKFYNQEFSSRRKSGEIRIGLGSAEIINIGGKPCRIVTITDITGLKKTEEALRDSEEKFSKAFSAIGNTICITSLKGSRFLEINESFSRFTGYTREEVIGRSAAELKLWVKPQEFKWWTDTIQKEGRVFDLEFSSRMKSGEIRIGLASAEVINIGGEPCRIVVITDITRRKQAEEALKRSEASFRHSLDDSPLGIRIVNSDDDTIYTNRALLDIFGYASIEEFRSIPAKLRLTPESYAEYLIRKEKRARGEHTPLVSELRIIRKDGEIRYLETMRKEVLWNGEIRYQILHQDITERRKDQEAIAESEERFNKAFQASINLIAITTFEEGNIIDINEAYCHVTGYKREDLIGKTALLLNMWVDPGQRQEYYRILRDEGRIRSLEVAIRTKFGDVRTLLFSAEKIMLRGQPCLVAVALDITERKQAEERINHLNITLHSIRNINQLITREKNREALIKGVCHNLVESRSCNSAWMVLLDESRKMLACAESGFGSRFLPMLKLLNQGTLPPCAQKALKSKRVVVIKNPGSICAGCPIQMNIAGEGSMAVRLEYGGNIYGVLCVSMPETLLSDAEETELFKEVATDIALALYDAALRAERDLLIQERLRAAKLESIGTLAGGIAHDFNNLLTGIMGNIGLVKTYLDPADKTYEMIDEAEKAAVRARDLTQQLLTFAKGGKPVKKLIKIAELIKESATFALRGSNVRLELSLPDDLWPMAADEGQISQVIHNLVINADEAMPTGGILKIGAWNFEVNKTGAMSLPMGNYIQIDFHDTGVGISEEHLQRIFEPYFTTKQKGSGLGLTTVYSIVKNHGGYILAESALNQGTTFHIYLPASKKTVKAGKKTAAISTGRAGGKVLIMDDEEIIRKMLNNMLDLAGYKAELTSNGAEALEKYVQALETGKPFNAVIMDLTIPGGMGGKEAIKKLLKIDPNARVIVSSGYATDPIMSEYKKYGFSAVITKPYSVKQLEETLFNLSKGKKKR